MRAGLLQSLNFEPITIKRSRKNYSVYVEISLRLKLKFLSAPLGVPASITHVCAVRRKATLGCNYCIVHAAFLS